jgi:hypothetical protein
MYRRTEAEKCIEREEAVGRYVGTQTISSQVRIGEPATRSEDMSYIIRHDNVVGRESWVYQARGRSDGTLKTYETISSQVRIGEP